MRNFASSYPPKETLIDCSGDTCRLSVHHGSSHTLQGKNVHWHFDFCAHNGRMPRGCCSKRSVRRRNAHELAGCPKGERRKKSPGDRKRQLKVLRSIRWTQCALTRIVEHRPEYTLQP